MGLTVFALLAWALDSLFNIRESFFFIMAFIMVLFVCPIGFLVGAVGSIVLAIKNKRAKDSS